MSREKKSCVSAFLRDVRRSLADGGSLRDQLKKVTRYHELDRKLVNEVFPTAWAFHHLVTSKVGLTLLLLYEYIYGRLGGESSMLLDAIDVAESLSNSRLMRSWERVKGLFRDEG